MKKKVVRRKCLVDEKVYAKLDKLRKDYQEKYGAVNSNGLTQYIYSQIGYFSTKHMGKRDEVITDFELCGNNPLESNVGCPAMPHIPQPLVAKAIEKLASRGQFARGMLKIAPLHSVVHNYHGTAHGQRLKQEGGIILLIAETKKQDKIIYNPDKQTAKSKDIERVRTTKFLEEEL
jgi:hypothetical protein